MKKEIQVKCPSCPNCGLFHTFSKLGDMETCTVCREVFIIHQEDIVETRLQDEPNFDSMKVQCMKCQGIQSYNADKERYKCKKCWNLFYKFPKGGK